MEIERGKPSQPENQVAAQANQSECVSALTHCDNCQALEKVCTGGFGMAKKSKLSPTCLFFNYEIAVARGDKRAAERAAAKLRQAGFQVRHVTTPATPPAPVTGDAEIRPGEKFCEDALAETCEALRVELGNEKNTSNELRAKIADLEARRDITAECNLDIARDYLKKAALQLGMSVQ